FVAERSADKMRLVIAGSHGKTTTTAMVMHILQHQGMDFDYLVGSKLDGFELMVRLSDAPIIVIEGDEYLSSALDLNPKFLWYKPHVSVITGIAWDHINVFPTYEQYVHQFERFIDTLPEAAAVYYYGPDQDLSDLFKPDKPIIAEAYETPEFRVTDQGAVVTVNGHDYPMQVFGAHNFANMQGAVRMVGELEISEEDAWKALSTFKGTARRLEKMNIPNILAYKDFAHSPSKVKATVEAVRSMYPEKSLVAALELHTFSSLNKDFIPHYNGTMNQADRAFVHYNPHVLEMKSMPDLPEGYVQEQLGNVQVITKVEELKNQIAQQPPENAVYLFMSSGNWAGTDWVEVLRKRD
ncbi:MAG: peptidoglycan synthetase, partial [Bacteroidetes bacterium]|nr:peptidoglycan synthetase [Bacteroidota bacterium]